ncbi:MAG: formate/nitrite transporter family protein [Terriglobales bacterium]
MAEEEPESTVSGEAEIRQVEEREAIGANVVYETIRREGDRELERSWPTLAWSGLAAGLSMGFSMLAQALLAVHLPNALWRPLVAGFGYCLGFLIVVLGRQQLFTENTLTVILPLLLRKDRKTLGAVGRVWGIVLGLNLVGTGAFAVIMARSGMLGPAMQVEMTRIGMAHLGVGFGTALWRAIFAGWLIALMVWLLPGAQHGRVAIIIILTYIIGLGSFNHVIAGSTTVLYLVARGQATWGQYAAAFLAPSLLGNVIGGVALVAALGYAQIESG